MTRGMVPMQVSWLNMNPSLWTHPRLSLPKALLTQMLAYRLSMLQAFATWWDETILALKGDMLGWQICTTVKWSQTAFHQAANGGALQVTTLDNLDALFDADPLLDFVGPFAAGEVSTELIRANPQHHNVCATKICTHPLGTNFDSSWGQPAVDQWSNMGRGHGSRLGALLAYLCMACTLHNSWDSSSQQSNVVQHQLSCLPLDEVLYTHVHEHVIHQTFLTFDNLKPWSWVFMLPKQLVSSSQSTMQLGPTWMHAASKMP